MSVELPPSPPEPRNDLARAARWYAEKLGWRVFPLHSIRQGRCSCGAPNCKSPGKHPRTPRGCTDASSDPGAVAAWWKRWPDAHVGVATGAGLVVVDIDPRHGGDDTFVDLKRTHGALPDTLEVLTGSDGRHIYLRVPADASVTNSAGVLGPGVDVRGEGGYVVAPPSGHISGGTYRWESSSRPEEITIAEAPEAWLNAMRARPKLRALPGGGEPIAEGGRNEALFRRGAFMRAARFEREGIVAALLAENDAHCNPPLDPAEVKAIAASVCRYDPGFPAEKAISRETARTRRAAKQAPTEDVAEEAPAEQSDAPPADPDAWRAELITDRFGAPRKSFANTLTILTRDPDWIGRLAWDVKAQEITLDGSPVDDARVAIERAAFEREHGYDPGSENFWLALRAAAGENAVDPVADYLRALAWDGTARLDGLATSALGAAGEMPARMLRRWFISAVARALKPGCKVDTVLVLVGEQGARKSTFFQVLAGEHFSDSHVDLANKDAFLQFRRAWVLEWGEIERITGRRGADEIKSLLASRFDDFRPPFGRALVRVPRSCVIVGSTNQQQFLDDETGSRRFWVIRVSHEINAAALAAQRDQLWAEAVAAYLAGEPWWFDAADDADREKAAEEHTIDSPWEQSLRPWITEQGRGDFLTSELLYALNIPTKDHADRRITRELGRVMRRLGYQYRTHRVVRGGKSLGPTRAWVPRLVDGRAFGRGDAFEGVVPEADGGDDASR